jgi:hypothetical protein
MDTDEDFAVAGTTLFIRPGLSYNTAVCVTCILQRTADINHLHFGRICLQVLAKQDKYVVHIQLTACVHASLYLVEKMKYIRKAQSSWTKNEMLMAMNG